MISYATVCSGIEAPSVAWHSLNWRPVFFSEIGAFPRAVLKHHYPKVPCHGDFTTIKEGQYPDISILAGGTPCQDFSVAGLREGLAGARGNLTLEFARLLNKLRPRWFIWENVPGVFSFNDGRDFGAVLACFSGNDRVVGRTYFDPPEEVWLNSGIVPQKNEKCYGLAYRVLDAQFFGVPQRRRRVFVVGHLGDWRRAAAVLFERHSLSGNSAPRREAGEGFAATTAPSLTASGRGVERTGESRGQDPVIARCLNAHPSRIDGESETFITHALRAEGFDASEDGTGRGTPLVAAFDPRNVTSKANRTRVEFGREANTLHEQGLSIISFSAKDHGADAGEIAPTLRAGGFTKSHANGGVMPAVAFQSSQSGMREVETHATLDANMGSRRHNGVVNGIAVRRLTPRECERLQGFPDDYTLITYRGKPAADGPRYKALGNSMAVPVMRWIGERIELVESLL